MTPTLTELRELEKRATQGEWSVYLQAVETEEAAKQELGKLVEGTPFFRKVLPMLSVSTELGTLCPVTTGCGSRSEENAAFIAALVNWFRSGAIEELERDAENYRLLRERGHDAAIYVPLSAPGRPILILAQGEQLDACLAELRKDRK